MSEALTEPTIEEIVRAGAGLRLNLSYANLIGANLRGADLRGANLSYATLCDCNLTGARVTYRNRLVIVRFYEVTDE